MCEAIIDLFREEYDAGIKAATEDALQQGQQRGQTQMLSLVNKMLQAGDGARIAQLADRDFMNEMCMLYGV